MEHDNFDPAGAEGREATRERLQAGAIDLQSRRAVAAGLATQDLSIAERIQVLGFNEDTAKVFDLLPVIHVAWADGAVQRPERDAIMRVLEARGVVAGMEAYTLVESLLERAPGQAYMDETLGLLRELVADNTRRTEALIDLCFVIAEAHGAGLLGLRDPIDKREREALYAVANKLGDRAQTWVKAKFGEL